MRIRLSILIQFIENFLRTHFPVGSDDFYCYGHVIFSDSSPSWTSKVDGELFRVFPDDFEKREACESIRKCIDISPVCPGYMLTDQKPPSSVHQPDPKLPSRQGSEHIVPFPLPDADCLGQ